MILMELVRLRLKMPMSYSSTFRRHSLEVADEVGVELEGYAMALWWQMRWGLNRKGRVWN
jgi:hypothetical protein